MRPCASEFPGSHFAELRRSPRTRDSTRARRRPIHRIAWVRRATACALLAALPPVAGCTIMMEPTKQRLSEATRAYEAGDLRTAETGLNQVIQECPAAPESAEAFYVRGLCFQKTRRLTEATRDFRQCLKLSKRQDLTGRAHAALGALAMDAGRSAEACTEFEAALAALNDQPPAEEVYYRYAQALQRAGKPGESQKIRARMQARFPVGRFASDQPRYVAPVSVGGGSRPTGGGGSGVYTIQCGAFAKETSADDLIHILLRSNVIARRELQTRGGRPMHVVLVGQYSSEDAARSAMAAVKPAAPQAMVVPVRS